MQKAKRNGKLFSQITKMKLQNCFFRKHTFPIRFLLK